MTDTVKEEVDLIQLTNDQAARIAELEREVQNLRSTLNPAPRMNEYDPLYWRNLYLEGKVRRQAEAIRNIQKVGWQPSRIIREVPYPDDQHLWDEPPPESRRRPKRRPSVLIEGV